MHSATAVLLIGAAVAFIGTIHAERMDVYFNLRSYDASMWYCNDGVDREIPKDAPNYKDRAAMLEYIKNMKCPEKEKPFFRTLKDGSTEPDVLDDANCWVSLVSPSTGDRHSYLVASDGYHDAPGGSFIESVEAVSGKNYIRKQTFQTRDLTWKDIKALGMKNGAGMKIDSVIDKKTNYLYKGTDFCIGFALDIVDDETRAMLTSTANNWPVTYQLLDNYYFEKHGNSAFERFGVPRGDIPRRTHMSEMTVHDLDVTPNTEPVAMDIFFVLRSYDASMWHCRDRKDRKIPKGAPNYKDKAAFMAYVNGMTCPDNEKPWMRKLKDGSEEPDVLDDGNCWVSMVDPRTQERHVFLVTSDGYHDVRGNTYIPAVEDVSGKNYVKLMNYKTRPMTFKELKEIGARVNAGRKVDDDMGDGYLYKGSDFAIDFIMEVVEPGTRAMLKESANNWPISMQLLDNYYFEKHGNSAFDRHGIPRGTVPPRAHLSTMSVHGLEVEGIKVN